MVFFAMANAGLPGTSGFVGEFMVILATFRADFWYALLAATTLILAAAFTLWMVKRVVFGPVGNERVAALKDLDRRERLNLGVLAAATLAIGIWPKPLVDVMEPSIQHLVQHVQVSKLPATAVQVDAAGTRGALALAGPQSE
jgi:NADH-quinone oxidoreductase subunit M